MTEPLPENIRRAGYDALHELSNRMARGSTSLLRHALRLLPDDAKSHREALAQLRRYQSFEMPCSEEVAVIEGALMSLNEPESKALSERRRLEKHKKDEAERKRWEEAQKSPRPTYWEMNAREEVKSLQSEVHALAKRARALDMPEAKPSKNGNVISGPWDTAG